MTAWGDLLQRFILNHMLALGHIVQIPMYIEQFTIAMNRTKLGNALTYLRLYGLGKKKL